MIFNGTFAKSKNNFINEKNAFDFGNKTYYINLYLNEDTLKVKSERVLKTGWYYISEQETNYKRQLEKSSEIYFIDPKIIISAEQFIKLQVSEKNIQHVSTLLIHFDTQGTESWSLATGKSLGGKLALIINDKLVTAPSVNMQITSGMIELSIGNCTKQDLEKIIDQIKANH